MTAAALLEKIRHPSPRGRMTMSVVVALLAIGYLLWTSLWQQDRDLFPKFHDEHMHLLQMQHLAQGKLWMPQHELADHFETFHVFVKPVYASIYFPGTALVYVPTVWLKLPKWVMPLIVAGACCGMIYRVVTELLDDGVAALLAALMLVSIQWFRYLAMIVMSHSVMLMLGLCIIWAWLRWRDSFLHSPARKCGGTLRWSAGIGALGGLAAITRPVDAICYALPIGIAMLLDMRPLDWRGRARTVAIIVACAAPFLALQFIQNLGISRDPFKTPYRLYADLYTPQMSFGFHRFDPSARPQTDLPQRIDYYNEFTVPAARAHRLDKIFATWKNERLPLLGKATLPSPWLLALLPFGLLALRDRTRIAVWAVLPLWVAMYAMFAYLLPWYAVVVAPPMILWALLGKQWLERLARKRSGVANAVLSLGVVAACASALPGIDREVIDDGYLAPTMWFSYAQAPKDVQKPAIILFRYRAGDNVNEEPVYNVDVANPDDAPIIRAHDLGPQRNQKLFDYYAARQPQRFVYLYDRSSRTLLPLGNVAELAGRDAAAGKR